MRHLCHNHLTLHSQHPSSLMQIIRHLWLEPYQPNCTLPHKIRLPAQEVLESALLQTDAHQISLLFITHNYPPVMSCQILGQQYPDVQYRLQYLDEFGLYAGCLIPSTDKTLRLQPCDGDDAIRTMANQIFDLSW